MFGPLDLAPRGGEHAGLIGELVSEPVALRASAQFQFKGFGLPLDLRLDDLASDLVADDASDLFEFGELGVMGQAVRIDLLAELSGEVAECGLEFGRKRTSVLAHLRDPLQGEHCKQSDPRTSRGSLPPNALAMQTMSCAPAAKRARIELVRLVGIG